MEYYSDEELNGIITGLLTGDINSYPDNIKAMFVELADITDKEQQQEKAKEMQKVILSKVPKEKLIDFLSKTEIEWWKYVDKEIQGEKLTELIQFYREKTEGARVQVLDGGSINEDVLETIVRIWEYTDESVQLENLELFDELVAEMNELNLVNLWIGTGAKVQLERKDIFIPLVVEQLGNNISEKKYDAMCIGMVWNGTTHELQSLFLKDVFERLKEFPEVREELWRNTLPNVQMENIDIIYSIEEDINEYIDYIRNLGKEEIKEIEESKTKDIRANIDLLVNIYSISDKSIQNTEMSKIIEQLKTTSNMEIPGLTDYIKNKIDWFWRNTNSEVQTEFAFDEIIDILGVYEDHEWNGKDKLISSEIWKYTNKDIQKHKMHQMIQRYKENPEWIKEIFKNTNTEIKIPQNELTDIFRIIYPDQTDEYIASIVTNYLQLEDINNEIRATINFEILNPKVIEDFGIDLIARMSNYEDIQKIFLENIYDEENIEIIKRLWLRTNDIKSLNVLLNNMTNYKGILSGLNIENLQQENFDSIIDFLLSADGKDKGDDSFLLTDDPFDDLWGIRNDLDDEKAEDYGITDGDNPFGIKTVEQLKNFNSIRRDICNQILEGKIENLPVRILALTEDDRKRLAILELAYGIDLNGARNLIKRFDFNAENIELTEEQKNIQERLSVIRTILETDDIDHFKYLTENNMENKESYVEFQNSLIEMMEEIYNGTTYKSQEHREDMLPSEQYIDENGQAHKIDVFEIKEDFRLFARSEGAYNHDYIEPENFYDAINTPNTTYHRKL